MRSAATVSALDAGGDSRLDALLIGTSAVLCSAFLPPIAFLTYLFIDQTQRTGVRGQGAGGHRLFQRIAQRAGGGHRFGA